jgi:hypothetical protein
VEDDGDEGVAEDGVGVEEEDVTIAACRAAFFRFFSLDLDKTTVSSVSIAVAVGSEVGATTSAVADVEACVIAVPCGAASAVGLRGRERGLVEAD